MFAFIVFLVSSQEIGWLHYHHCRHCKNGSRPIRSLFPHND